MESLGHLLLPCFVEAQALQAVSSAAHTHYDWGLEESSAAMVGDEEGNSWTSQQLSATSAADDQDSRAFAVAMAQLGSETKADDLLVLHVEPVACVSSQENSGKLAAALLKHHIAHRAIASLATRLENRTDSFEARDGSQILGLNFPQPARVLPVGEAQRGPAYSWATVFMQSQLSLQNRKASDWLQVLDPLPRSDECLLPAPA